MSELITNLNNILDIKGNIKSAIENKGVDMTGVSFGSYPDKIGEITTSFVTVPLNVSANGTYTPGQGVDGYSQVVVDVPQSVTGFTEKEITEGVQIVNLSNSASYVIQGAFILNQQIQTVYLPNCTNVKDYAFQSCTSLTQVSLPVCNSIGYHTFDGCTLLSKINLPVCSYIRGFAFGYCSSLSQVSLPMCSSIDNYAFYSCSLLSQVSLPMCSSIGDYVFRFCSSLSIINIGYSSVCRLGGSTTFERTQITSSTGSIYVPTSLVESYKSATHWSYFSTQIFPIPE